ncbi:hypothetical protein RFN57_00170 [Streptomyces violaceochromogenes]|uniref:Uncharacterized protein n=1 Tax=Streptomyces violaceochromogenes TaxID=67377 RepID=A0ABU6LML2_9ACTN|nr:hypothetical protein [Streptomyces violaceochromogenes]MEC7050749.1 hypothetical protein [Streptomyces violaceochromogenes]GHC94761.1 hypothetical protein GCM10010309_80490 [Streptomyces violaceochromogenes]
MKMRAQPGTGVGGAAVGVAGAVVQGERGRGVVVVAEAGGGELLEGGAGEKRGGQGCGQAGVSGRVGQAAGNFPGSVRGERCGRQAVSPDDRRCARGPAGGGAVVRDEAVQSGQGDPAAGPPDGIDRVVREGRRAVVVVVLGDLGVGNDCVVDRVKGLMQGGRETRAVADQSQANACDGAQLKETFGAAGGQAVGAQDGQTSDWLGGHPRGGGFPGGLSA